MKINAIQIVVQRYSIYLHAWALAGSDAQCLMSANLIANVQNDWGVINCGSDARMKMCLCKEQFYLTSILDSVKCLFDTNSYSGPEMQPGLLLKIRMNYEQIALIIIWQWVDEAHIM